MTIGQGEYKSSIGLDKAYFAIVSKDDATAYTAGTPQWLAPAVSAKVNAQSSSSSQYADDKVFESTENEGESVLDLEFTSLPLSVLAVILGKTYNETNGMFINGTASAPPECALLFRVKKSNGKYRYRCYLKGKFSMTDEDFATLEANSSPKNINVKYKGVWTIFEFTTATGKKESVKDVAVDEDVAGSATLINSWYTAVPVPVAPAGGT